MFNQIRSLAIVVVMLTVNSCSTMEVRDRDCRHWVIKQEGRDCRVIVTDPEGEMYLTIIDKDEAVKEFHPDTHVLTVLETASTNDGLKQVVFIGGIVLNLNSLTITVVTTDFYQINESFFRLLCQKFDIVHIKESLDAQPDSPESEEPPGTIIPSRQSLVRLARVAFFLAIQLS
ncbi:MAG: hypothetical protein RB292_01250 [Patescibacteria group bacterium]|jgi:hypothetical protein|nr:hypothetical protein [Patescibacteria group bacterium]